MCVSSVSLVTRHPWRTTSWSTGGIAVISLDCFSLAQRARTSRCSVAHVLTRGHTLVLLAASWARRRAPLEPPCLTRQRIRRWSPPGHIEPCSHTGFFRLAACLPRDPTDHADGQHDALSSTIPRGSLDSRIFPLGHTRFQVLHLSCVHLTRSDALTSFPMPMRSLLSIGLREMRL